MSAQPVVDIYETYTKHKGEVRVDLEKLVQAGAISRNDLEYLLEELSNIFTKNRQGGPTDKIEESSLLVLNNDQMTLLDDQVPLSTTKPVDKSYLDNMESRNAGEWDGQKHVGKKNTSARRSPATYSQKPARDLRTKVTASRGGGYAKQNDISNELTLHQTGSFPNGRGHVQNDEHGGSTVAPWQNQSPKQPLICPTWLVNHLHPTEPICKNPDGHHHGDQIFLHSLVPGLPQEGLECRYWNRGRCNKPAEECFYEHRPTRHGIQRSGPLPGAVYQGSRQVSGRIGK